MEHPPDHIIADNIINIDDVTQEEMMNQEEEVESEFTCIVPQIT